MLEEYQTSGFEEDVVSHHANVPLDVLVEQSEEEDVPVSIRAPVDHTFDELLEIGKNSTRCMFSVYYISNDNRVDAPKITVERAEFVNPMGARRLAKLFNFSVGGGYKEADVLGVNKIAVSLHFD